MMMTASQNSDGLGIHFDDGKTDAMDLSIYCHRVGRSGREFTKKVSGVTCPSCVYKLIARGAIRPTVGMGATEHMYSDRHAFTVIAVSASGKTATLRADTERRLDSNGMSESQAYEFTPNPAGEVVTVRLTKNGWQSKGRRFGLGYRDAYYDFTF